MGFAILIFGGAVLAAAGWLALHLKGPYLRSPYLHPLFFFGFMTFLIALDFFVLGNTLQKYGGHFFSQYHISGTTSFNYAAGCFVLMTLLSLVGYLMGAAFPVPIPVIGAYYRALGGAAKPAAPVVLGLFLLAFLILMAPTLLAEFSQRGLLGLAAARSLFIGGNPVFALIVSCVTPAFFLFATGNYSGKTLFIISAGLACFYVIIGSRGAVMMVLLAFAVSAFRNRKLHPLVLLALFLVLVLVGYYYTYLTRYTWKYGSLAAFWALEGDPFTFIMNSPELSIADSMMLHLNGRIIAREWYDSILGATFAYIPRDIIPWKPTGFSTAMTAAIDYERWILVQSEWTVSGYVNAIYEMGLIGGGMFNMLLFAAFGSLDAGARNNRGLRVFATCLQVYLLLGYLRGDIYNMGLRAWSVIVVLILLKISISALETIRRIRRVA